VRRTLGLGLAGLGALLAAYILGEYELSLWTSLVAGLVVGGGVSEALVSVAKWRGWTPAVLAGLAAGVAVAWAGRIDSNYGIDPYPTAAWLGAAVATVVAGGRLALGARPFRPVRPGGTGTPRR
jgi:hypothetical protein